MLSELTLFGFPLFTKSCDRRAAPQAVLKVVHIVKSILTSMENNPDALVNGFELLRGGVQIYNQIRKIPQFLQAFNLTLDSFSYAFYTLRLPFYYLEYFVHSIRDDEPLAALGNILYFFSDVGSSVGWFNEIKLIDLSRLTQKMGSLRFIGSALVKIPLNLTVTAFCGFAYIFFGMDAVVRLSRGTLDQKERFLAWLDITNSIIQVALMTLLLTVVIPLPITLGLTIISGSISCVSFGIRYGKMLKLQ